MSALLVVCALVTGFVAAAGFLFGQLFAGHFTVAASCAGIGGILCAGCALRQAIDPDWAPRWVYGVCLLALLGVAMDVFDYYRHLAIAGNYYGWGLVGPFVAGIVLVAAQTRRRRRRVTRTGSDA